MRARTFSLVLVALSGCGSDKTPVSQTEYCNKYAQDICAAVVPACLITTTTCMAGRLDACSKEAQQNIGRDFIPTNAESCLSKVADVYGKLNQGALALNGAAWNSITSACANVYRGSITLNGPCSVDVDCLDGMICDKGFCGRSKVVAQGQGCANIGEVCPQGSYCGSGGNGVLLCLAKVGLGAACSDTVPCLENLRCAAGACAVQLGLGLDCVSNQDCTSGFCEPFAKKCAEDIRFANGSAACSAMGS